MPLRDVDWLNFAYQKVKLVVRPDRAAIAHYKLGEHFSKKAQWSKAIEHYEKAKKHDFPNLVRLHCRLAQAMREKGQLKQAEESFRQAIAIDSHALYPYLYLGSLLNDQKKWALAVEMFEKARDTEPANFWPYYHLG
ncbi:MAG: tetratricopeptide repeat protein, partial [Cyanobacteria bacterium J06649_4]